MAHEKRRTLLVRGVMPNFTDSNLSQFNALKSMPDNRPFDLLVQLLFRPEAVYPDGETRDAEEAYDLYFRAVFGVLHRVGASQIWRGKPHLTLVGPETVPWNLCHVMRYPSRSAYLSFITDAQYLEAQPHWNAAVEDSRVFCVDGNWP